MWGACSGGGVIAAALSFGLALMVFAASFGHISGVHFNPAVTIGVLIAGEMQAVMAILYVVMQLLGGKFITKISLPFIHSFIQVLLLVVSYVYYSPIVRTMLVKVVQHY